MGSAFEIIATLELLCLFRGRLASIPDRKHWWPVVIADSGPRASDRLHQHHGQLPLTIYSDGQRPQIFATLFASLTCGEGPKSASGQLGMPCHQTISTRTGSTSTSPSRYRARKKKFTNPVAPLTGEVRAQHQGVVM